MPRTARIVLSNYPHHIIQRGHNKQAIFANDNDYLYYLENLKDWKYNLCCKVYAYCLMTNHIHLILDPGEDVENLSKLMKRVAGRQTRYINKLKARSGTLWESRYKSSPIGNDEYLMMCCRYIELNPVRAGMVEKPEDYRWSSCRHKLNIKREPWLDDDPFYSLMGSTMEERTTKYIDWLDKAIPDSEIKLIREAAQRGQLTGGSKFVDEISKKIGHRVELRGQGRPRKDEK